MQYEHIQKSPLYMTLIGVGIATRIAGWRIPDRFVQITVLCSGSVMFLLTLCFRELKVSDKNDRLVICFGPLGVFVEDATDENTIPGSGTYRKIPVDAHAVAGLHDQLGSDDLDLMPW